MLGCTTVNLLYTFYPIGNTPAVNVLHDRLRHSSDGEDSELVKAMFLACGDPRNLLFSLYSESGYGEKVKWDFTCCDVEPAVLARNILLFSLIIEKVPNDTVWNIFYHLYVRECDMAQIRHQAKKLLYLSASSEKWASTRHGKVLNFLSKDTLQQLRGFWERYVEIASMDSKDVKSFEKSPRAIIKATLEDLGDGPYALYGFRSAGVHWSIAASLLHTTFSMYWKTGVVGGNEHDIKDLGPGGYGRLNPLLAVSSSPDGAFAVDRNTDPLLGFHLASCFEDIDISPKGLIERLVLHAKGQLLAWSKTFREHVRSKTVRINVFCGDALRFCYELQAINNPDEQKSKLTRTYTAQWKSAELTLENTEAPEFKKKLDVVDASTLVDEVGLLNALPAIAPLLSRRPTTTLFTDTLQPATENLDSTLSNLLCGDVNTVSLILGIAPVAHLTGFSVDGSAAEAARALTTADSRGEPSLCYVRIAWKAVDFGLQGQGPAPETPAPVIEFDERELAEFSYKLFLQMFRNENTTSLAQSVIQGMDSPQSVEKQVYTRLSFVLLLDVIKRRIDMNWKMFLNHLLEKIYGDDHLFAGKNSFQGLQVLMYLCGLFLRGPLPLCADSLPETPFGNLRPRPSETGLLAREEVASIVFLTISVPRDNLKLFTKRDPKKAGTPGMQIGIHNSGPEMDDHYFSFQCFFGRLSHRSGDDSRCDVVPDDKGWKGKSDLIVICPIAAWSLLVGPRENIRVKLQMTPTAAAAQYAFQLNREMEIFNCGLDDPRVRILSQPPGASFDVHNLPNVPSPKYDSNSLSHVPLARMTEDSKINALHMLAPGVEKTDKEITVTQTGAYSMSVRIEDLEPIMLRYPYPVDGNRYKTNFLTGDGLDLIVPISPARVLGGFDLAPFPVFMQGSRTVSLTIPHIKLDKQPIIDVKDDAGRTEELLAWCHSAYEHKLIKVKAKSDETPGLLELKSSIYSLYEVFFHTSGKVCVFELSPMPENSTLIFIAHSRHNDHQGSVVLDAYVICLDPERIAENAELVADLIESGQLLNLALGPKELSLWKQLLPAQVECCRTTWTHGPNCEYMATGCIPLSTELNDVPICSCGHGFEIDDFPKNVPNWEKFAKIATRVSISPISTVPFIHQLILKPQIHLDEFQESLPQIPGLPGPSAPAIREKCDHCGKISEARLRRCQRCDKTKYCNHPCQKGAWRAHKKQCRKGQSDVFNG